MSRSHADNGVNVIPICKVTSCSVSIAINFRLEIEKWRAEIIYSSLKCHLNKDVKMNRR